MPSLHSRGVLLETVYEMHVEKHGLSASEELVRQILSEFRAQRPNELTVPAGGRWADVSDED